MPYLVMGVTLLLLLSSLGLAVPTQEVQCKEPVIANAEWIWGSRPPYGHLSTVTYKCRPGYTMMGESTQTCGIGGQWSPGLPTCQRLTAPEATTTTPSVVRCEVPRIKDAEWIGGAKPPHGYQSVVTYMCKSGYTMIGEPTLTCGRDGQWSPGLPTCHLLTCDQLPPVESGTFSPDKEIYRHGEVVEYSCQEDYTLSGSRTITCSDSGRFEPAPPTCVMVQCEEPVIANAEWAMGSRPPHGYQSTVMCMCKPGYTMIGEPTLTCGTDSQWSPGLPTCQRKVINDN